MEKEREDIKRDYTYWLFKSNKHYIRNLLLLYISIYPLFSILDYYASSTSFFTNIHIRLFIGLPLLIVAYTCTFIPKLIPYIRTINATALLVMNLSISIMYASLSPTNGAFDNYFSGLIITIATLGLSMSKILLINTYIIISALTFMCISFFVHNLHIENPLLFIRSSTFITVASGLFMVSSGVIERFSLKLFNTQECISREKDRISHQKDTLENLNQTKDRFFSIISHDLRSPFTSLIGYFDILLNNDKQEFKVKKEDIQKIFLHTRRTYNLLNNLLNWSKTQLNQYNHKPQQYNLNEIFSENSSLYREIANQKEIKITHSFPNGSKVYCDKEMIATIVRNLIFNAIKFTRSNGEIHLTGKQISDNELEIAVVDNGIGISDTDIENILSTSAHHTQAGTHNEKGAGIGLIICNDILKKHHSRMQIESKKNIGSKFFFILPINSID